MPGKTYSMCTCMNSGIPYVRRSLWKPEGIRFQELELFQVKSHMGAGSQTWVVYMHSKRSQLMSHLDRLKEEAVAEESNWHEVEIKGSNSIAGRGRVSRRWQSPATAAMSCSSSTTKESGAFSVTAVSLSTTSTSKHTKPSWLPVAPTLGCFS